jgi:hypothetical protein
LRERSKKRSVRQQVRERDNKDDRYQVRTVIAVKREKRIIHGVDEPPLPVALARRFQ